MRFTRQESQGLPYFFLYAVLGAALFEVGIPLVVAITTAMSVNNGILVRDRMALEAAREIDMVIFDKTGTLTEGRFGVVGIETADGISPAVKRLHEMGVQVAMQTGDSEAVAKAVPQELGIDTYDAPALTRANVGIAIGSGTDVAVESAGIILVKSNPLDVVKIIGLSRASYRKMRENLIWAAGYNVIAIPLEC